MEIEIPQWILVVLASAQAILNRWIPEPWRPVSLGVLAVLASVFLVVTHAFPLEQLPMGVGTIFLLVAGTYALTKPAEKVTAGIAKKSSGDIGKGIVGLAPAGLAAALIDIPGLMAAIIGALVARLLKPKLSGERPETR
jgi:hypothetical protein